MLAEREIEFKNIASQLIVLERQLRHDRDNADGDDKRFLRHLHNRAEDALNEIRQAVGDIAWRQVNAE